MIDKVIADIEANQDRNLEMLKDFIGIESISTDPACKDQMRECALWVHTFFGDAGIPSEIVETAGHPAVIADTGPAEGDGPVVLVYGHYDVQPVGDEKLWDSPPFKATIRNGDLFARGSADDKGQVFTHMLAAKSWMKVAGKVPVRLKFLVEGEEEVGSPNLEALIRDHRDRLACDYIAISDTAKLSADQPAITYGTKGMIYKEVTVTGPKQDLHSGSFGGTVTNPGNALAAMITSFRDADNRVTIPGFYDDVQELTSEEKARFEKLPFNENDYLASLGSPALDGEKGYTTLQRRWVRPTLDVNGICGGFIGEGASTIIPAKMMAKISMRIVPDQDPDKISNAFDEAVRAAAPSGVKVSIQTFANCAAYVSPLDSPGMKAAAQAVEAGFGKAPVFTREGGSLPILPMFKEILGAESIMMGFCLPNCNLHGPNEFFGLSDFHNGTKAASHFAHFLAKG